MKIPQNKRLLIDGDILRYRCAFAAEKTHYLVDCDEGFKTYDNHKDAKAALEAQKADPYRASYGSIWSRKELQPVEFAYHAVNTTLTSFASLFSPSNIDIYLSDSPSFRDKVAVTKPYKGNRSQADKPKYYKEVGEFLLSRGAIVVPGLEADDALAIGLTKDREGSILLSIDKDLDQVPGLHYNWVTDKLYNVTPREGDFSLYMQLLTGDATDNVPGLPGVGPVAAKKVLDGSKSSKELFQRCRKAYADAGKTEEYFIEQLRLVYILRKPEEIDGPKIEG